MKEVNKVGNGDKMMKRGDGECRQGPRCTLDAPPHSRRQFNRVVRGAVKRLPQGIWVRGNVKETMEVQDGPRDVKEWDGAGGVEA